MVKICFISAGAPHHGKIINKHFNKYSKLHSSYFFEWNKTFGYTLLDPSKFDILFNVGYFQTAGRLFRDIKLLHPDKKIINLWIGTDILQTKTSNERGLLSNFTLANKYIDKHITNSKQFQTEIEVFFDLETDIIPTVPSELLSVKPLPNEFSISTFVPDAKPEWYNYDLMIEIAREFKKTPFYIFGWDVDKPVDSPNITHLGFLKNKEKIEYMKEISLFIRIAVHDSVSVFMIEFLQMGRYVINKMNLPCVFNCNTFREIVKAINEIKELKEPNREGSEFYRVNYSPKIQVKKIEELLEVVK